MGETLFRPCCGDAYDRRGSSALLLGTAMPRLLPADEELPAVPAAKVRHPANIARHEVGHALVAMVLGGTVGRVTIEGQALAQCRLPEGAPWSHRVAVDLAGDGATVGEVAEDDLNWHLTAVRQCGGGMCDRCSATRQIVVGMRHPPDAAVIAEYRRIEAVLAEFFVRPEVRELMFELAWWLGDELTITGDAIGERFGPQIAALNLQIN
jgi:hypothetical protein